MPTKKKRVCLVSSEITPFAKTGGLADVAAGLSRYLGAQEHDVRPFMPLYPRIREGEWPLEASKELQDIDLSFGARAFRCRILTGPLPGTGDAEDSSDVLEPSVHVYFVDCPELFDRPELYTNDADEPLRFALLCRAALAACQRMQWSPDVIHCNDWHTGLLPLYLRTSYAWDDLFAPTRTLLTIHNIGYQGVFPSSALQDLGLMEQRRHFDQDDLAGGRVNFLKTGLMHADRLSTVSQRYAEEIQTPEFGMGLEDVLRRRRADLVGIVNGVDYDDWDPATDVHLLHHYTAEDLGGKRRNKQALLEDFHLTYDERVPVIGIVSRLTGQKGFDLLPDVLPIVLQRADVRLVVLGSGETKIESYFQWLRDTYPDKVAFYQGYNNQLAHRIEAGADLFLMPSRYEPCGLNQLYSLRYGTPPLVRRTGGLADTVTPFDAATGEGTGFVFGDFEAKSLFRELARALSVWEQPAAWARAVQNGMAEDWSWDRQGPEYVALYESLPGVRP